MTNQFPIYRGNTQVGTAEVHQWGLYYEIHCCCNLPEGKLYKIQAAGPGGSINLGTCILNGKHFVIHTRVPAKYLGAGEIKFTVPGESNFSEIVKGKPFSQLDQVYGAKLAYQNGIPGIWFTEA